jgi:hypothetical protein
VPGVEDALRLPFERILDTELCRDGQEEGPQPAPSYRSVDFHLSNGDGAILRDGRFAAIT